VTSGCHNIYVKPLIDTGVQIDLIRRDIIKKLRSKIVKMKTPQHIVGYFRGETSKKL